MNEENVCTRCGEGEEMIMVDLNDKITLCKQCYSMFDQFMEGHQQLEKVPNPEKVLRTDLE
jgi:hypothetical protein